MLGRRVLPAAGPRLFSSLTSARPPLPCTADLSDDHSQTQVVHGPWFDYGKRAHFHGIAETLRTYEDNGKAREILSENGRGKILVIDGAGSQRCALFGDQMAALAVKNQWEGVIVYGCVRDVSQVREMDLGCKAVGTSPKKSNRRGAGERGVDLEFRGVVIKQGSYVVSDHDGVVVLPEPPKGKL